MTLLKRSLISHLIISISLYVFFALLDIFFTLKGVNGDIAIEGNPIMRYMMANFGLMGGLVVEKSLVLLLATTAAIVSVIGIEKEADWVYYLAFTRVTRNWMKRKKRYWVAFLPLYFVAFSLGVAAASWVYLIAEITYS
jgi:hypothetical protein